MGDGIVRVATPLPSRCYSGGAFVYQSTFLPTWTDMWSLVGPFLRDPEYARNGGILTHYVG